ncbi:hypothetical protein TSAR_005580 [Trichomalopsis sarcophagae]|uniref:Uncharacterized protein n=1 Tax=Trichomalopsis sarcophagae TaxID=543379 RepID=A0A232EGS0_9HYME|nr:hypothetical protein TSAR_005580 [Trichomalopsis sarcophagae]
MSLPQQPSLSTAGQTSQKKVSTVSTKKSNASELTGHGTVSLTGNQQEHVSPVNSAITPCSTGLRTSQARLFLRHRAYRQMGPQGIQARSNKDLT